MEKKLNELVNERLKAKYPGDLFKEHWEEIILEDEQNDRKKSKKQKGRKQPIEQTLYRWWYEFVRAAHADNQIIDEIISTDGSARHKIEENEQIFGDLGSDFASWWAAGGAKIFSENGIPLIKVYGPEYGEDGYSGNRIFVEIPLTIARELIIDQINVALDICHPRSELRRHEHSTARLKIYPKQRQRSVKYDELLKVWIEKRTNGDKKPLWQIYCEAKNLHEEQLMLAKRKSNSADLRKQYADLAAVMYQQADELIRNAVQGVFPKDTKHQAKKGRKSNQK